MLLGRSWLAGSHSGLPGNIDVKCPYKVIPVPKYIHFYWIVRNQQVGDELGQHDQKHAFSKRSWTGSMTCWPRPLRVLPRLHPVTGRQLHGMCCVLLQDRIEVNLFTTGEALNTEKNRSCSRSDSVSRWSFQR